MALITDEMKEVVANAVLPMVGTCSRDAKPNVVPIHFTKVISENEILLMDNYMNKTRANIDANPYVAISVWDAENKKGYQFKGSIRIEKNGTTFEEGIKWVKSTRPETDPKAAIIVTVDEIYTIGPGDMAGKRIA
ncbi:pyridoxamine 5'-phosphate oxidase family protein [Thermodesulfobacteriota bacterium]